MAPKLPMQEFNAFIMCKAQVDMAQKKLNVFFCPAVGKKYLSTIWDVGAQ